MPRWYVPQSPTMLVEQVQSGRRAGEVAAGLGISRPLQPGTITAVPLADQGTGQGGSRARAMGSRRHRGTRQSLKE